MKKISVYYDERQSAKMNTSFSPSAGKPKLVLESWQEKGYPIVVKPFEKLTRKEIAAAHDYDYVKGVLDRTIPNGFGNTLKTVADSLPWTTGSLYAAAKHAVETREPAISLTSGFHHAGYDRGSGFCTFNGLVIAAQLLYKRGLAKKIGIVDLDMHYGNGTAEIIDRLNIDHIHHYTFGGSMLRKNEIDYWLDETLPEILMDFNDCDVILYQAGADPHENDPLGGLMTSEQMRRRDQIVFSLFKKLGIPVAWCLAGGYQTPIRKVLDIHDATIEECLNEHVGYAAMDAKKRLKIKKTFRRLVGDKLDSMFEKLTTDELFRLLKLYEHGANHGKV